MPEPHVGNIWGTLAWQTEHAYCDLQHCAGMVRCVKHRTKRPWWWRIRRWPAHIDGSPGGSDA